MFRKLKLLNIYKVVLFTSFSLFSIYPITIEAQTLSVSRIDSVVTFLINENKIPGVAIGIVKDGKVIFQKGYGSKQIGKNEPIDSTTNFVTCSISKLFTATAIMQLVEQGKIDITKNLTDYLPEFKMKDNRYKKITIAQILTHTSGLPNIANRNFIHPKNDSVALQDFANKLKHKRLSYSPGVQLSAKTYSNTGYDILGLVIERTTHQTYSRYVTNHVLKPVGMEKSSFFIDSISPNRRSTPHVQNWLTRQVHLSSYYPDIPQDKPCGNLNSCTFDLCKWMIYNLNLYNKIEKNGIITTSTLHEMWTIQKHIPPYRTAIGLGWWIYTSEKYGTYLFHVGNDPGYSAQLILFPAINCGIIVLCNAEFPRDVVWNTMPFAILNTFISNWGIEKK